MTLSTLLRDVYATIRRERPTPLIATQNDSRILSVAEATAMSQARCSYCGEMATERLLTFVCAKHSRLEAGALAQQPRAH